MYDIAAIEAIIDQLQNDINRESETIKQEISGYKQLLDDLYDKYFQDDYEDRR